jgi:hypothetical protein
MSHTGLKPVTINASAEPASEIVQVIDESNLPLSNESDEASVIIYPEEVQVPIYDSERPD